MQVIDKKHKMTGDFEIIKTGVEASSMPETILKEKNTITSGMSHGIAMLFGGYGSQTITDYVVDRFQAGTAGDTGTSGTIKLETPLTKAEYDTTNLHVEEHYYYDSTDANNQSDSAQAFALIPKSQRTMIGDHSVRYTLVLDAGTAVGETITELGLFMKNPAGFSANTSMLVAYKYFTGIAKTANFSLTFRWTLNL